MWQESDLSLVIGSHFDVEELVLIGCVAGLLKNASDIVNVDFAGELAVFSYCRYGRCVKF